MHVLVGIYIYVCVCVCVYEAVRSLCIYTYMCATNCKNPVDMIYIYIYIYTHTHIYTHAHTYAHKDARTSDCIGEAAHKSCGCVYIYIYTHT
jgi:hypothetical protein